MTRQFCWDTCYDLSKKEKSAERERKKLMKLRVFKLTRDDGLTYGEAIWQASQEGL